MNRSHAYRLLLVIKNNLSIDEMLAIGLNYFEIASLLSELFVHELIIDTDDNGIILTQKGKDFIAKETNHTKDKSQWILPLDQERIEKINIFDVYLPRKKK